MKRCWFLTGILLGVLLLIPNAAHAGGAGLFAGYWDTDDADSDTSFGFRVVVDLGRGGWNLDARATFFEELTTLDGVVEEDFEAMPIDLNLTYDLNRFFLEPESPLEVYLGGGITYLNASSKLGKVDDEMGVNFVVGVQYTYTKNFAIFGDLGYRQVDAQIEGAGFDFVQRKLALGGLGASLGFLLAW